MTNKRKLVAVDKTPTDNPQESNTHKKKKTITTPATTNPPTETNTQGKRKKKKKVTNTGVQQKEITTKKASHPIPTNNTTTTTKNAAPIVKTTTKTTLSSTKAPKDNTQPPALILPLFPDGVPDLTKHNELHKEMDDKLKSSQFRYLNEQLYTMTGKAAKELFDKNPELPQVYHMGYRRQVAQWPLNPLTLIIESILLPSTFKF